MKKILKYYPSILVKTSDGVVMLKPVMDDWYGDHDVLRRLGSACGARTVGEIIEAVNKGSLMAGNGILSGGTVELVCGGEPVVDEGDLLVMLD